MITQSELGGAQSYVFDLAKNLKSEYNVIICYGEQGEKGKLAKITKELGIDSYVIDHLGRSINYKKDWFALLYMIKLIKAIKPDILHLNSSKISILGSIAGKICGIKNIIYTAHGWVFNEKLSEKKKNLYVKLERFTAKFKHKIICVSDFDYKAAIEQKICDKKKLTVIHNGIEEPKFKNKTEAKKIISDIINHDYNIDYNHNNSILLGSIGNLYKNKGFGFLVNATKVLLDNNVNVKTIIIGEGSERKELENWITQLRLKKHVFLLGRIDNAKELLKAFDVYICSSTKEGLSYTLIEAMMAELPIIATSVGGNKELISHDESGLIVPPENTNDIANSVISLLDSKEISGALAHKARGRALSHFAISRMVKETKNLYDSTVIVRDREAIS